MGQASQPGGMDSISETANVDGKHEGTHVDNDQASQRREASKGQEGEAQAALADRRLRGSENIQPEVKGAKPTT